MKKPDKKLVLVVLVLLAGFAGASSSRGFTAGEAAKKPTFMGAIRA